MQVPLSDPSLCPRHYPDTVSGSDTWLILDGVRDVLHEFLDPTAEVAAEFVYNVSLDVGPMLIDQFGEGHPVQASDLRNLLQCHTTAFPELKVSHPLFEFES